MKVKKTVFVGISGGVDSAVAALRLKQAGYNVVGVFIKVWQPDFIDCNWEAERLDAMRVAAHLDIPFLLCDAEAAYRDEVAHFFIKEYEAGRTPNPDTLCNRSVKFGAFYEFAKHHGADYIATGHYAQITKAGDDYQLKRGVDASKDQSYFLWMIQKDKLANILLPIGSSPKEQIRREAAAATLPVATKKDSQGICFLGQIDIPEFLAHYLNLVPGSVMSEDGEVIGSHSGAAVYTVGQRHGFTITAPSSDRPVYYVTKRNLADNTLTVSTEKPVLTKNDTLVLNNLNLFQPLLVAEKVEVETRYHQKPVLATVLTVDSTSAELQLEARHEAVAAGQSCVLYRGEVCVGGGIIARCQYN